MKRERAPLLSIQDGYPKQLLGMDRFLGVDHNGRRRTFCLRPDGGAGILSNFHEFVKVKDA